MLDYADFNEVYANKPQNVEKIPCEPPACFVVSYAPVKKAAQSGTFYLNNNLLKHNRKMEVAGPVPVRSKDLECGK